MEALKKRVEAALWAAMQDRKNGRATVERAWAIRRMLDLLSSGN